MAKKKIKQPIVEKSKFQFKIGEIEYDNGVEIRNVYLDDKIIYTVDCTKLAGLVMRDQNKDVMDAISKEIGRTITLDEFRRIKLFGIVEK